MSDIEIWDELAQVTESADNVVRSATILASECALPLTRLSTAEQVAKLTALEMVFMEIQAEVKLFQKARKALITALGKELVRSRENASLEDYCHKELDTSDIPKSATFSEDRE